MELARVGAFVDWLQQFDIGGESACMTATHSAWPSALHESNDSSSSSSSTQRGGRGKSRCWGVVDWNFGSGFAGRGGAV